MQLHANLVEEALVDASELVWTPSPQPGVDRLMIERDGAEVARCTTVVKYAPNARFPHHVHSGAWLCMVA